MNAAADDDGDQRTLAQLLSIVDAAFASAGSANDTGCGLTLPAQRRKTPPPFQVGLAEPVAAAARTCSHMLELNDDALTLVCSGLLNHEPEEEGPGACKGRRSWTVMCCTPTEPGLADACRLSMTCRQVNWTALCDLQHVSSTQARTFPHAHAGGCARPLHPCWLSAQSCSSKLMPGSRWWQRAASWCGD
jgi:hypothetical protein